MVSWLCQTDLNTKTGAVGSLWADSNVTWKLLIHPENPPVGRKHVFTLTEIDNVFHNIASGNSLLWFFFETGQPYQGAILCKTYEFIQQKKILRASSEFYCLMNRQSRGVVVPYLLSKLEAKDCVASGINELMSICLIIKYRKNIELLLTKFDWMLLQKMKSWGPHTLCSPSMYINTG